MTNRVVEDLSNHPQGCLAQLEDATRVLDRSGFVGRPEWHELRAGRRPPDPISSEPGEWKYGWQYHGSSSLEYHFKETVMLTQSCPAEQAHLRSHSGPGSSAVLHGAPTSPEYRLEPQLFRALVLERVRLPLDVTESRCECGDALDTFGRHRAACPRSGRLRTRAVGLERTLARVCREAGATVRYNTKLRDMNVAVAAEDERAIEVLASGLPIRQGAQLAVDVTVRCALTADGLPTPGAARHDGAALLRARADKERKYTELVHNDKCQLVVVALETGGRWSDEATKFFCELAGSRAREVPPMLQGSTFYGWLRRWTRMLSISCGRAFASSLVSSRSETVEGQDGPAPDLADLFCES